MKPLFAAILSMFIISSLPVHGQDSTAVRMPKQDLGNYLTSQQAEFGRDLAFNSQIAIINPDLEYEMDESKLYINEEFTPHAITLVGGITDTVAARIQLVNHIVEVKTSAGYFQVDPKALRSIVTAGGRHFVASGYSLGPNSTTSILEVIAQQGQQTILLHHKVEWRKPSGARNSYNAETFKMRMDTSKEYYYAYGPRLKPFRNLKALVRLLPGVDQVRAKRYIKEKKLRNQERDYAALLSELYSAS